MTGRMAVIDGVQYGPGWDLVEAAISLDAVMSIHEARFLRKHGGKIPHQVSRMKNHVVCADCVRVWYVNGRKGEK